MFFVLLSSLKYLFSKIVIVPEEHFTNSTRCSQMEDKDREVLDLRSNISDLEARLRNVDLQKSLELTQQSQRWEEFSRLADSMKNLSQTMMTQTSAASNSPRLTMPQQY